MIRARNAPTGPWYLLGNELRFDETPSHAGVRSLQEQAQLTLPPSLLSDPVAVHDTSLCWTDADVRSEFLWSLLSEADVALSKPGDGLENLWVAPEEALRLLEASHSVVARDVLTQVTEMEPAVVHDRPLAVPTVASGVQGTLVTAPTSQNSSCLEQRSGDKWP